LAPFQKNLCAKSKSFWRGLLAVFGAMFLPILAHSFAKYVPLPLTLCGELKKVMHRKRLTLPSVSLFLSMYVELDRGASDSVAG
ncbi:hypothetical protein, partial [Porphyromonas loveana]|uniref:hypothetical protein n=1 Tax=Porphyromonas loveana TaxID=1884669 RepID=UPI0035A1A595